MPQRLPPESLVDETVRAVDQGLGTLRPVRAVDLIDRWNRRLREADTSVPLDTVLEALGDLRGVYQQPPVDSAHVGALLSTLARRVTQVARDANPPLRTHADQLAGMLGRAGLTLSGQPPRTSRTTTPR